MSIGTERKAFADAHIVRPELCTDDMLEFLDDLRESGVTNMFGAGAYVAREFALDEDDSAAVLGYWMATFAARHTP